MDDLEDLSQTLQHWTGLMAHQSMREFVRLTRGTGLSLSQINVLFHIHHKGPSEVCHLRNFLLGSPAAASQIVERLVQAGLIERSESADDRRVKIVSLTPKGTEIVEKLKVNRQRWIERLAGSIPVAEREQANRTLHQFIAEMKRLQALDE